MIISEKVCYSVIILLLLSISLSIAQYYKIIVDTQIPSNEYVVRMYEGDNLFLKTDFYENRNASALSNNWQMFLYVYKTKYTNELIINVEGTWYTNNGVTFISSNKVNEHGEYYFTIRGTNQMLGAFKVWATGKVIVDSIYK